MLLHTINKSPYSHRSLESCISVCRKQDAILLIEDAVYGIDHPLLAKAHGYSLYALEPDLVARGLHSKYAGQKQIKKVSYDEFVNLCIQYPKQKNW